MPRSPDNEPNIEQRIASIETKAHGIADKIEEMSDWDGTWEPPEEGPDSNTVDLGEVTAKELEAIQRGLKKKALDHYQRRGFSPSYVKYITLYEKYSNRKIRWHSDDPKYLKMKNDGTLPEEAILDSPESEEE